jgi:hypothetical protein
MTVMDITIHQTFRIMAGPAGQPGTSVVLEPPAADLADCRLVRPAADFASRPSS